MQDNRLCQIYAKLTYIVVFVKYLQFHFNDMLVLFSFAHLCNVDALLMLCDVLVYNIPILTYIIILTFIFLDGYMYVCIHFMYVCIIINYCTWIHICGGCRARNRCRARTGSAYPSRAPGSTLLLSYSLIFRRVHFTVCVQLVWLIWTMDLAASTCSYITSTGQNICINIHNLWWYQKG